MYERCFHFITSSCDGNKTFWFVQILHRISYLQEWAHLEWDHGDKQWFELTLQIPPGSFQIAIEVQRGWKAYSDYGIDDVRLENGTCTNLCTFITRWRHQIETFSHYCPLWGECTGDRWIPLTKSSDADLWCFLWSAPVQTVEQTIEKTVIWDVISFIMTSL